MLTVPVLSDQEIRERVRSGDTASYELIIRRYNQRLFRVARAILNTDADAEDAVQNAYVRTSTWTSLRENRRFRPVNGRTAAQRWSSE